MRYADYSAIDTRTIARNEVYAWADGEFEVHHPGRQHLPGGDAILCQDFRVHECAVEKDTN